MLFIFRIQYRLKTFSRKINSLEIFTRRKAAAEWKEDDVEFR